MEELLKRYNSLSFFWKEYGWRNIVEVHVSFITRDGRVKYVYSEGASREKALAGLEDKLKEGGFI